MANLSGMARRVSRDILLNTVASSVLLNSSMRVPLMRILGMDIDPSVRLLPGAWFSGRDVSIGPNANINVQCFFDESAPISIGANVSFGPQVMIHTSAHDIGGPEQRCSTQRVKPVKIGNGVWLGLRTCVLPGVTVGDGCVIAAGAVVAADCEPNGLYGGVPARRLRDL